MSIARYDQNSISDERLMQIGDQLNAEKDSIGFLRMTNRTHSWNCSGYSLGSIVSTASMWAKRSASGAGALGSCSSLLSVHKKEHASTSLTSLYNLLIAPLDDVLQSATDSDDVKVCVGSYKACFNLRLQFLFVNKYLLQLVRTGSISEISAS